jgi:hypothetical protein
MSPEQLEASAEGGSDLSPDDGLSIAEALASRITTVNSASLTLSVGVGTRSPEQTEALLPLVECNLDLEGDDEEPQVHNVTLTLDNFAFLLDQATSELSVMLLHFESMSQGRIRADPGRTGMTADWLARSSLELASAAETLRRLK